MLKRLLITLALLSPFAAAQTCHITSDASPPAVNAGATHAFTASTGCTAWSVSGPGSINVSTGLYTAPPVWQARDVSRGWQLLPDNSVYKLPINSLPVDSHSAYWLQRVIDDGPSYPNYHYFKLPAPGIVGEYDNVVNNSTPTQRMHFYYLGQSQPWQDTLWPIPLPPDINMQVGWSQDILPGWDMHIFSINSQTGDDAEMYAFYPAFPTIVITAGNPTSIAYTTNSIRTFQNPLRVFVSGITGGCSILNGNYLATIVSQTPGTGGTLTVPVNTTGLTCSSGTPKMGGNSEVCPTCNSQSGQHWFPYSNAIDGGTNAAGSPLSAASVHAQEWWNVVQQNILDPACNCVTVGHLIMTTLANRLISPRDTWPAIFGGTYSHPNAGLTAATTGTTTTFTTSLASIATYDPCSGFTYTPGCTFHINIGNTHLYTGAWAAANGDWVATAVDNTHFTIPLNSTGFPTLPPNGIFIFDWMPYGTHLRLKSGFNENTVCTSTALTDKCPYEKAILNTLKVYGLMLTDGTGDSDNWGSAATASEFNPDQLTDAANDLRHNPNFQHIEQYLEIVDMAGQQVNFQSYTDPNNEIGLSNYNRVTVTASCGGCTPASLDVMLQGTAIGTDRERISMVSGTTYQINAWVTGNPNTGITYAMNPAVTGASVSSTGLITAPLASQLSGVERTTITMAPVAGSLARAFVDVYFIPVSSDGNIRLAFGQHGTSYTDTGSKVWWGQVVARPFNSAYEIADGTQFAILNGTWQAHSSNWISGGTIDPQLYAQSTSSMNDTNLTLVVPNGNYNLTLYGEPGYGITAAGHNVYDAEVQGVVAASFQDGFLLSGSQPYHGYTAPYTATVSDGLLQFNGRIRQYDTNGFGMSLSSLLIAPVGSAPLNITSGPAPNGTAGVFYTYNLTATGGTPSYTWSFSVGDLTGCPGLSLTTVANVGVISGTPSAAGTCAFTEEVTDSATPTPASRTQPNSITITPAVMPNTGLAGSASLTGSGSIK
jgi:hypothetical protein